MSGASRERRAGQVYGVIAAVEGQIVVTDDSEGPAEAVQLKFDVYDEAHRATLVPRDAVALVNALNRFLRRES